MPYGRCFHVATTLAKKGPPSLTGAQFLVQADQDLAAFAGLTDGSPELGDPSSDAKRKLVDLV